MAKDKDMWGRAKSKVDPTLLNNILKNISEGRGVSTDKESFIKKKLLDISTDKEYGKFEKDIVIGRDENYVPAMIKGGLAKHIKDTGLSEKEAYADLLQKKKRQAAIDKAMGAKQNKSLVP
jgi:hypothetical protein